MPSNFIYQSLLVFFAAHILPAAARGGATGGRGSGAHSSYTGGGGAYAGTSNPKVIVAVIFGTILGAAVLCFLCSFVTCIITRRRRPARPEAVKRSVQREHQTESETVCWPSPAHTKQTSGWDTDSETLTPSFSGDLFRGDE